MSSHRLKKADKYIVECTKCTSNLTLNGRQEEVKCDFFVQAMIQLAKLHRTIEISVVTFVVVTLTDSFCDKT